MAIKSYRDLDLWQKAVDLTVAVYELTRKLPQVEAYALTNHIKRAVLEIPARIAVGNERKNDTVNLRYLYAARGNAAELETQLIVCVRIGYLADEEVCHTMKSLTEVGKMTTGLIKTIEARLEERGARTST